MEIFPASVLQEILRSEIKNSDQAAQLAHLLLFWDSKKQRQNQVLEVRWVL